MDDEQAHLLHCKKYSHLAEGLNVANSDIDLVTFYQRVIREREAEEDIAPVGWAGGGVGGGVGSI